MQANNTYDPQEYDSDDDCYSVEFKEKEIVDARFNKPSQNVVGWHQAEVVVALDEMVRVKLMQQMPDGQQAPQQWMEKESHKLARQGTITQNEKASNHEYFCQLYNIFEVQ